MSSEIVGASVPLDISAPSPTADLYLPSESELTMKPETAAAELAAAGLPVHVHRLEEETSRGGADLALNIWLVISGPGLAVLTGLSANAAWDAIKSLLHRLRKGQTHLVIITRERPDEHYCRVEVTGSDENLATALAEARRQVGSWRRPGTS